MLTRQNYRAADACRWLPRCDFVTLHDMLMNLTLTVPPSLPAITASAVVSAASQRTWRQRA